MRTHNYILETRGELLWASLLRERKGLDLLAWGSWPPTLAVTMYALEEDDASGKMRWVERNKESLGDLLTTHYSRGSIAHRFGLQAMDSPSSSH